MIAALSPGGQLRGDARDASFRRSRAKHREFRHGEPRDARDVRPRKGGTCAWRLTPHGKRHVDGHGRRAAPRRRSRSQRLAGRRGSWTRSRPRSRRRWNARYDASLFQEANALTEEFDVGVQPRSRRSSTRNAPRFAFAPPPTTTSTTSWRWPSTSWDDTGRKSNWPTAARPRRAWRCTRAVYGHWVEGELFTSEAADAISSSAAAEASSEMRKLGTAELQDGTPRVFPRHGDGHPAIVGPDGESKHARGVRGAREGRRAPRRIRRRGRSERRARKAASFSRAHQTRDGVTPHRHRDPRRSVPTDVATRDRPTGAVRRPFACDTTVASGRDGEPCTRRPQCPSSPSTSPRARRDFEAFAAAEARGTVGGAAAAVERTHSCPSVTSEILASLEEGRITFDVYVQQDGGAAARARRASLGRAPPTSPDRDEERG